MQSNMLPTRFSVLGWLALLASLALADGSTQLLVPGLCCPFVYATCSRHSVVDTYAVIIVISECRHWMQPQAEDVLPELDISIICVWRRSGVRDISLLLLYNRAATSRLMREERVVHASASQNWLITCAQRQK